MQPAHTPTRPGVSSGRFSGSRSQKLSTYPSRNGIDWNYFVRLFYQNYSQEVAHKNQSQHLIRMWPQNAINLAWLNFDKWISCVLTVLKNQIYLPGERFGHRWLHEPERASTVGREPTQMATGWRPLDLRVLIARSQSYNYVITPCIFQWYATLNWFNWLYSVNVFLFLKS